MSKKLHQALGDWRSTATNVKARIYAETIEGKKKKKRLPTYIKLSSAAAVLAIGVTGAILMTNEQTPTPVPAIENNTDPKEEKEVAFRPINETFLMIEQYETFYRKDNRLYTQEDAISMALSTAIQHFALFNHLAEYGMTWDKKERNAYKRSKESALEYDLKDPAFVAYFEKMLKELSITKEQYIEEYLLVKQEYEMLHSKMLRTGLGLKDGNYEVSTAHDAFRQKMGISYDYMEYLAVSDQEHLSPLDPQPTLSFNEGNKYPRAVTKNLAGEYIFIDAQPLLISLITEPHEGEYEIDYFDDLMYTNKISGFSRYTYPKVKVLVEQKAEIGDSTAQKILDYFEVLERSIDWELEPQRYEFNNILTFNEENLRVHNDLTLKIAEYEIYEKDESIQEEYAAYRYANELVGEMYGLFNYLAQDFNYGWSSETRAKYKASLIEEVEASMQNEVDKAYINQLLQTFNITIDDYVQYYLLPKKEFETLKKSMLKDQVGVDKNGRYNPGKQSSRYRETVGMAWQDMYTTMDAKSNNVQAMKALETQPDLPFSLNPTFPITVGLDENGDYVMEYPSMLEISLTEEQQDLLKEIRKKHNLPPLARYSVQAYIAQAQLLSTKTAKELVEILILFDRTVN